MTRFIVLLAAAVIGLTLWSFPGQFNSTDGNDRYRVAHAILTSGLPEIGFHGDGIRNSVFTDEWGPFRSYFGPGHSLVLIPLDIPGTLLTAVTDFDARTERKIREGLAAWLNLLAVSLLLFFAAYRLAGTAGLSEGFAGLAALTSVLGTTLWNLSRAGQEEAWLAVFLLAALECGIRFAKTGNLTDFRPVPWILGAGLLFRPSFITVVLAAVVLSMSLFFRQYRFSFLTWLKLWVSPGILVLALTLMWNLYRTGNYLDFGYGTLGGTFTGNAVNGWIQPILGFDKGVIWTTLWFFPALFLIVVRWNFLTDVLKAVSLLLFLLLVLNIGFYSNWFSWAGDHAWGARFQANLMPGFAVLFWGVIEKMKLRRVFGFSILAVVGIILWQIPSLCLWDSLEYLQSQPGVNQKIPATGSPTAGRGQIAMRAENILLKLKTGTTAPLPDGLASGYATTWNFWPWMLGLKAFPYLFVPMLILWWGILGASGIALAWAFSELNGILKGV